MKVKFNVKITQRHMFSFLMNNFYRKPMSLVMVLFGIACFVIAAITYKDMDPRSIFLLLLLGSLYTIINPFLLWSNSKRQYKKNPVYANEITYEFDEKGVTVSQGDAVTTQEWAVFWKARDFGKIIVLYLAVNNGIIIPKDAIGEQYDAFCEIVSSHVKSNIKKK